METEIQLNCTDGILKVLLTKKMYWIHTTDETKCFCTSELKVLTFETEY